jgi:hypothetical protein
VRALRLAFQRGRSCAMRAAPRVLVVAHRVPRFSQSVAPGSGPKMRPVHLILRLGTRGARLACEAVVNKGNREHIPFRSTLYCVNSYPFTHKSAGNQQFGSTVGSP